MPEALRFAEIDAPQVEGLSLAEIDGQHVELLPARTVLSTFKAGDGTLIDVNAYVDDIDNLEIKVLS